MNPEDFAKAKEHFWELVDLSESERTKALSALETQSSVIAQEVRSLLNNHFSRTIIQSQVVTGRFGSDQTVYGTLPQTLRPWQFPLIGGIVPFMMVLTVSVLIGLVVWGLQFALRRHSERQKASELQTILGLEQSAIRQWTDAVSLKVESWARSTEVRAAVKELVEAAKPHNGDEDAIRAAVIDLPAHGRLEKELNALAGIEWPTGEPPENCQKFAVWNREAYTIADWNRRKLPEWIGKGCSEEGAAKLVRIFQKTQAAPGPETFIFLPRAVTNEKITSDYPIETEAPQIQVITGVRDDSGKVIAALMVRDQKMMEDFEQVVNQGRFESTGECYLMDEAGWMMNETRFSKEMTRFEAFKPYFHNANKRLWVRVADPGGDVTKGFEPVDDAMQWSRTKAARGAISRKPGVDVEGYRDYRGKSVIGAWHWDERLNAALIVEQDAGEAYAALRWVDTAGRMAWGIPLLCAVGILGRSAWRHWKRRGLPPESIGPYKVTGKIGEGGLGVVYRAEHRLLGRPAAIKLLKQTSVDRHALTRFEREVRLAARLVHPNAVSIYDFGTTEWGEFYYAMEHIPGVNLADFTAYAESISLDRCLHLMIQVCGAIREAHLEGLVHRDIKPQNIMVCLRGGIPDVVKVLDYGLVKSFRHSRDKMATETRVVMGTPKFMAPERLDTPWLADPRIDVFSIGAVFYYIMLKHPPLLGMTYQGLLEVFSNQRSAYAGFVSDAPFQRCVRLIASCVSPEPMLRPGTVTEILEVLYELQRAYPWDEAAAADWWNEHERKLLASTSSKTKSGARRRGDTTKA